MEKILDRLKEYFGDRIAVNPKTRKRVYISASKRDFKEIIRFMIREQGARMAIATAVDTRPGIEVLYHMAYDKQGAIISLRVMAEKPDPVIESITDIIEGAEWIEREMHEMFGLNYIGQPKPERLLLPDDWPDGVYPLLKQTFESEKEGQERPDL
jgi:Ni,Fe-hydrogenase III component G